MTETGNIRISIVLTTYNCEAFLDDCIVSIERQDFRDFEILLVDDASTDGTRRLIERYVEQGIARAVFSEANHGGPSKGRNRGVTAARGEYVMILDADDLLSPGALAQAVSCLDGNPALGLAFFNPSSFEDDPERIRPRFVDSYKGFQKLPKHPCDGRTFVVEPEHAYPALFAENFIRTSGVTVPRRVYDEVGAFDEALTNADDWDMWLRIARSRPIALIDAEGVRFRIRPSSISARGPRLVRNRIKVVEGHLAAGLHGRARRNASEKLAWDYFCLGYHHQSNLETKAARACYVRSLTTSFNLLAVKGILVSLMGPRLLRTVKASRTAPPRPTVE